MKQYEKYKDSGIEWLGEIPEHWKLAPIKHLFNFTTGFTPPTTKEEYYDGDLDWVTIADMNTKYVSESKSKITQKAVVDLGKQPIPKGSLMYSFKLSVGKVGFAEKDLYTNEAIFSVFPDERLDLDYYYYALQAILIYNANENIYGAKLLNQELILNSLLPKISLKEQRKIAEYLDYMVGRVDEIVSGKQAQIDRLMGYRKSMINEVVTKGLNPDAPMRDSGIEWLGEIPAHWTVSKVKYELDNLNYLRKPLNSSERYEKKGEYDYYGASGVIDKVDEYLFDGAYILIGEDGANILSRSTQLAFIARGQFWVNNHAHILSPKNGNIDYLCHRLECLDYSIYASGSAQPKLTAEALANIVISIPDSIEEQTEIVTYIEERTTKIDKIVKELTSQIEKLKEYKTSIISEAVTGKIDLREWKQPLK